MRRHERCDEVFTAKMRLCLFHNTDLSAEQALVLSEEEITAQYLRENGVHASNIATAGIGPKLLKQIGFSNCMSLRQIGFDSLYLTDRKFAVELNAAYGSVDVTRTFLAGASDAVAIAGSEAVDILGIHTQDLLAVCAGAPTEAHAVLQQLPLGVSLKGVDPTVLLDAGIRKQALSEVGYSLSSVISQTSANGQQLLKMGFCMK